MTIYTVTVMVEALELEWVAGRWRRQRRGKREGRREEGEVQGVGEGRGAWLLCRRYTEVLCAARASSLPLQQAHATAHPSLIRTVALTGGGPEPLSLPSPSSISLQPTLAPALPIPL